MPACWGPSSEVTAARCPCGPWPNPPGARSPHDPVPSWPSAAWGSPTRASLVQYGFISHHAPGTPKQPRPAFPGQPGGSPMQWPCPGHSVHLRSQDSPTGLHRTQAAAGQGARHPRTHLRGCAPLPVLLLWTPHTGVSLRSAPPPGPGLPFRLPSSGGQWDVPSPAATPTARSGKAGSAEVWGGLGRQVPGHSRGEQGTLGAGLGVTPSPCPQEQG